MKQTIAHRLLFTIMIQKSAGPMYKKTFKSQIQDEVQIFEFLHLTHLK